MNGGRGKNIKYLPHVFTERGLYMLVAILKGERAVQTTRNTLTTRKKFRERNGAAFVPMP